MKLNVCAGRHLLEGWVNVDAVVSTHPKAKGRAPDILADMGNIPLPDGCADELLCVHGIEHVFPWEAEKVIAEWRRLLKVGGLLAIECPDLIKCCRNIIRGYTVKDKHPDQMGVFGLYGDYTLNDPYMCHKFAYSPASMKALLERHGFREIQEERPEWHRAARDIRDMRFTARKA